MVQKKVVNKKQQQNKRRKPKQKEHRDVSTGRRQAQKSVVRYLPSDSQRGVKDLLMQITLPSNSQPIRIPTMDMPYTSVMKLKSQFAYTNPNIGIGNGFVAGDMLFALHGQPARMLEYGPVQPTVNGIYSVLFSTSNPSLWTIEPNTIAGSFAHTDPWPIAGISFGTGNSYKGLYQGVGISKASGLNFVFLSGYDSIGISGAIGTSTLAGTFNFEIWSWSGRQEAPSMVKIVQVNPTAGLPTVGPLVAASTSGTGYYAVKYIGTTVTSGTSTTPISISMTSTLLAVNQGMMIQLAAPELGLDPAVTQSVRRTASSLLITNTTSLNSRQGTVLAGRLADLQWGVTGAMAPISPSVVQDLANKYTGDAAQGCYTYMELTRYDEEFQSSGDDSIGCLQYDLDCPDMVNFIWISNPGAATAPNSYTVSVDTILEFQTTSQRYVKSTPPLSLQHGDLVEARRILNNGDFFHENPLHIRDLVGMMHKGWANIRQNANRYATTANVFAPPAYRPLISGLAHVLQR